MIKELSNTAHSEKSSAIDFFKMNHEKILDLAFLSIAQEHSQDMW